MSEWKMYYNQALYSEHRRARLCEREGKRKVNTWMTDNIHCIHKQHPIPHWKHFMHSITLNAIFYNILVKLQCY